MQQYLIPIKCGVYTTPQFRAQKKLLNNKHNLTYLELKN